MSTAVACLKLADNYDDWWWGVSASRSDYTEDREEMWARSAAVSSRSSTTSSQASPAASVSSVTSPSPSPAPAIKLPMPKPSLDFTSPYFCVRPSPKGGMGAFASRDIAPLTVILRENYLVAATDEKGHLVAEVDKLSVLEREAYFKLASYDVLHTDKAVAIFKTNRFRTHSSVCGIFLTGSRFNHACRPPITYRYDRAQHQLVFTTTRAVRAGDELTIRYCASPYNLSLNYGFLCDCGECRPPREVPSFENELVGGGGGGETDGW